jgi:hypothetical protein
VALPPKNEEKTEKYLNELENISKITRYANKSTSSWRKLDLS